MPRVSVVIPAYNAAAFLGSSLDSVADQTFGDLEVVVVDDGSVDDTARIAAHHPVRPAVVSARSSESGAVARNRGVAATSGEWIAFLDADDLWHCEHLARALSLADQHGFEAVSMGRRSFIAAGDSGGERAQWADATLSAAELRAALTGPPPGEEEIELVHPLEIATSGRVTVPSAVVVKRDVLQAAGGFPSIFNESTDLACWFQVSRLTPIAAVSTKTVYYRTHGGALSEGSEKEVRALATYVAMWYGNTLAPYRSRTDAAALAIHGATNATYKLAHLLDVAMRRDEEWRIPVSRAFEQLLVRDRKTARRLRRIRAKRRFEQLVPGAAGHARTAIRLLRARARG